MSAHSSQRETTMADGFPDDDDFIAERGMHHEPFEYVGSGTLKRLRPFIYPHRRLAYIALGTTLCFTAAQISVPLLIKAAVDSLMEKPGSWAIPTILLVFAGVILLNGITNYLSDFTAAKLAQRIIFDLRRAMFAHLQRVSQSFMDRSHVGRLMSRLQGDVNALQEFFETSVTAISDLALLTGIILVLFLLEWRLALLTLILIPVIFAIRLIWLPHAKRIFARSRDMSSIVNAALAENINGVRVVQASRREAVNLADFTQKANENLNSQIRSAWIAQIMVPTIDILTGLAMGIVILFGAWMILSGYSDVGVIVAYIFYVQRFFEPVRTLSQQYTTAQRAMTAAHRIFEVLDVPVDIVDRPDAPALVVNAPSVEFRDVSFGYQPGQPVLRHFNLTIAPHEVVALVGPTGSGKSSIISLISRLYDTDSGAVLIDGQDVRTVTRQSIARNIATIVQEPFLFTGTIEDNIRFTSTHASLDDIMGAARAVGIHDFIMSFADGYQTILEQRGKNLSTGQQQLLSFARALVADPAILIMDEATANIDSFVELRIQQALHSLMQGRTCILIAHRLATVQNADRIVVLRKGEIIEQGSPRELLRQGGLYARLHHHNYASFDAL